MLKPVIFVSLLLTTLATSAGLAHLFALPNKTRMTAADYLAAQQAYRGWDLMGVVFIGALVSILALTVLLRRNGTEFRLSLIALLCLVAAQAVFWAFTYPANQATQNWSMLPGNWMELRSRWEYSHAAGAVLDLAALISLFLFALVRRN
jgi:hypothetical protein